MKRKKKGKKLFFFESPMLFSLDTHTHTHWLVLLFVNSYNMLNNNTIRQLYTAKVHACSKLYLEE